MKNKCKKQLKKMLKHARSEFKHDLKLLLKKYDKEVYHKRMKGL